MSKFNLMNDNEIPLKPIPPMFTLRSQYDLGEAEARLEDPTYVAEYTRHLPNVRLATTHNITLYGCPVIDGHVVNIGEVILVKDQTAQSENGLYIVTGNHTDWTRAPSFFGTGLQQGALVYITHGNFNTGRTYVLADSVPHIGSSPIIFIEII